MNPKDLGRKLGDAIARDRQMSLDIRVKLSFDRPDIQVKAFWSNVHEGFYVVTGFGIPCSIYVKQLDRWLGAENELMPAAIQYNLIPDAKIEVVSPAVLLDIYRRGMVGMVKHRILGMVTG
jgi:hypothetical protein